MSELLAINTGYMALVDTRALNCWSFLTSHISTSQVFLLSYVYIRMYTCIHNKYIKYTHIRIGIHILSTITVMLARAIFRTFPALFFPSQV